MNTELTSKGGRPIPLANPINRKRIIDAIVTHIEHGMHVEMAQRSANISSSTYRRWKSKGEAVQCELEERDLEEPDETFSDSEVGVWAFWRAIKEAELACLDRNLLTIQVASQTHWQAAAWWCERRFPKEFGRKMRIEHSGDEDSPVVTKDVSERMTREQVMRLLSPEDRRKVIEARRLLQSAVTFAKAEFTDGE